MGPILLVMGIGAAIGLQGQFPEAYLGMLREINNQSATLILGMFALLAGLAIVNTHNLWVSDWRVIITILGWLAIVRGALSLSFPNKMYGIGDAILASRAGPMIGAVIILVLGGILSRMGYRGFRPIGACHFCAARQPRMSAMGQKQTFSPASRMSAKCH